MTRTRRIRWTAATALHLTLIAAVGYGTYQAVPSAAGPVWRGVLAIGITLTASLAADRPLSRLYTHRPKTTLPSPEFPRTGPEFARRHGNDSSTWTTADIDAQQNLAEIDAWRPHNTTPATNTSLVQTR